MRWADHLSRGVLWISVCCECFVLLGRGLCDGVITHPEESYRVSKYDRESPTMRRPRPTGGGGCYAKLRRKIVASLATVLNEPELQKLPHILHISLLC